LSKTDKYIPQKYWEKRLSKNFSLTGVGHSRFGLEYNVWLYRARLSVLRRLLKEKKINCSGRKLLDIGVGTGFYINFWEKLGVKHITGIDITTKAVSELKKRYPNYRFIKADVSKAGFLPINEKFDIVTAFDILFHIVKQDEFEQAIKNLKKLCHRNTIILVMDNFLKECKPSRGHENDRTLKYYKNILSSNGIEIEGVRPIFYLMNTPIDIERINGNLLKYFVIVAWRMNTKVTRCLKKLGMLGRCVAYCWALTLYCIDRVILKCTSVGPSTKLLLAKDKFSRETV
jgi:ubiquinone/menaquinone biosynthesis C-methylase UbiE